MGQRLLFGIWICAVSLVACGTNGQDEALNTDEQEISIPEDNESTSALHEGFRLVLDVAAMEDTYANRGTHRATLRNQRPSGSVWVKRCMGAGFERKLPDGQWQMTRTSIACERGFERIPSGRSLEVSAAKLEPGLYRAFVQVYRAPRRPGLPPRPWIVKRSMEFTHDVNSGVITLPLPLPRVLVPLRSRITIGYFEVTFHQGIPFSDAVLRMALYAAQGDFGNPCDGVPVPFGARFHEERIASFLASLQSASGDPYVGIGAGDAAVLAAFVRGQGLTQMRVFSGETNANACGRSFVVSYSLIWNTTTNNVLYLVLYPTVF